MELPPGAFIKDLTTGIFFHQSKKKKQNRYQRSLHDAALRPWSICMLASPPLKLQEDYNFEG